MNTPAISVDEEAPPANSAEPARSEEDHQPMVLENAIRVAINSHICQD